MKKFRLLLVGIILGLNSSQAQDYFKMGAKGGVNLANIESDLNSWDVRTSFHLGIVIELPISGKFYFGPEALFSSLGSKIKGEEALKLDYIQIPLMAKYYVTKGFFLEVGPQAGFLISSKVRGYAVISEDDLSHFDYGLILGSGINLGNHFFLQGRYYFGLANIWDGVEVGFAQEFIEKNTVIQFSLGYMF